MMSAVDTKLNGVEPLILSLAFLPAFGQDPRILGTVLLLVIVSASHRGMGRNLGTIFFISLHDSEGQSQRECGIRIV